MRTRFHTDPNSSALCVVNKALHQRITMAGKYRLMAGGRMRRRPALPKRQLQIDLFVRFVHWKWSRWTEPMMLARQYTLIRYWSHKRATRTQTKITACVSVQKKITAYMVKKEKK